MRNTYGFTIDAAINNQRVRLLVDTGSRVSMLDESLIKPWPHQVKWNKPWTATYIPKTDILVVGMGEIGVHKLELPD